MIRHETHRTDSRATAVLRCLTALPFALLPTFGALIANTPIFPPAPLILFRAFSITAIAVILLYLPLVRLGGSPRVAAAALSVGTGVFGLFPAVREHMFGYPAAALTPVLAICYLIGCVVLMLIVLRARPGVNSALYPFINMSAAVLAIAMLWQLWLAYGPQGPEPVTIQEQDELADVILREPSAARPDVYHIILDGFGRPDVLRAMYDLDLSDVLISLRAKGFNVADDIGSANYLQTTLSLASMLNGMYVPAMPNPDASSRAPLNSLVQQSTVFKAFKRLGYEIHFIGSTYFLTQTHHLADVCECDYPMGGFEAALFQPTPLGSLTLGGLDYRGHRNKIRRSFAAMETLAPSTNPRFLFAHVMAPHPPFVFDDQGRDIIPPRTLSFSDGSAYLGTQPDYRRGYRDQARYIAARVLQVIDRLEETSRQQGRDPVIIVHGDHGPRSRFNGSDASKTDPSESLPVLLAIRWSQGGKPSEVAVTSLVNIYRAFFNRYFSANLNLLPDRAFVSSFSAPYRFIEAEIH